MILCYNHKKKGVKQMIKNPKHLQTVWFIKNGNVVKGCYTGTVDEPNIWDATTTTKKARIGVNGESIYHAVNLNELFENETEAQTALKKQNRETINNFKKEIKTQKDLMQFPLNVSFGLNAFGQNAKIAYMERAKELDFNI